MSPPKNSTPFRRASSQRPIPEFHKMAFTLDQFRLDGKVAVVTGAGGRGNSIGRAYALGFANAGASIVVADLNGAGAESVAAEIVAAGGKAVGVQVDVADEAS